MAGRVRGLVAKGGVPKLLALYALLIAANLGAWIWAWAEFAGQPLLLGTAFLAWVFGLRHAVDADHIAAIDNVVRKLMQEGKRPLTVGLFFSLGHSTIVIIAVVAIAATAVALQDRFPAFADIGGVIGTGVSATFLLLIGFANFLILRGIWRTFQDVRRGKRLDEEGLNLLLADRGFLARIFRPLFGAISKSWHMYPLGFLFGLGFDTATEIGLISMSAAEAAKGMSLWATLVFPALFTAGMALVDTTDSVMMTGAYGWAFVNPIRKLWYNLSITAVSVIVAVLIGGLEGLGLLADKLGLEGGVWTLVGNLNDDLANFGFLVIGVFLVAWIASAAIYRWKGYDALESGRKPG